MEVSFMFLTGTRVCHGFFHFGNYRIESVSIAFNLKAIDIKSLALFTPDYV